MGITPTTAQLLLREAAHRPFHGTVITLGRQDTYFTGSQVRGWAAETGVALRPFRDADLHREPRLAARGFLSDQAFLEAIGFNKVVRVDYSNFEEVDALLDLNTAETPPELTGQFDVVMNLGTLEHVFHVPHALAQMHRLVRPEGRIVHLIPSANCLDHGFVCVSPTLVTDYYSANRYTLHQVSLLRYHTRDQFSPVDVYDYLQPISAGFGVGSLDDRIYYTYAVVQRTSESTCERIPQQAYYVHRWGESSPDEASSPVPKAPARADRLLEMTSNLPPLHWLAAIGIRVWRSLRNSYGRWKSPVPWPRVAQLR